MRNAYFLGVIDKINKGEKKVKVTKKEMEFLNQISTSDFANEGWCEADMGGVGDYDMKVVRGLMSSLEKKGVIELRGTEKGYYGQPITWVNIHVDYCDIENGKLINIEIMAKEKKNERGMYVR